MWFKHSMSIVHQLVPIYNTIVHKNKSYVALNVVNVRTSYHKLKTPTCQTDPHIKLGVSYFVQIELGQIGKCVTFYDPFSVQFGSVIKFSLII